MKPLTSAECRAKIAAFPPECRADAELIAFSMGDDGISRGLAGMSRSTNPFALALPKPKGKAR